MKLPTLLIIAAIALLAILIKIPNTRANDTTTTIHTEYVTIRWSGKENIQVIRPGGQVEFIWSQLKSVRRPDRTDERAFYMNVAMNSLAKDGYEFAGLSNDDLIMKRLSN